MAAAPISPSVDFLLRLLRRIKKAISPMMARAATPPTTPPTMAPVLLFEGLPVDVSLGVGLETSEA